MYGLGLSPTSGRFVYALPDSSDAVDPIDLGAGSRRGVRLLSVVDPPAEKVFGGGRAVNYLTPVPAVVQDPGTASPTIQILPAVAQPALVRTPVDSSRCWSIFGENELSCFSESIPVGTLTVYAGAAVLLGLGWWFFGRGKR